MPHIKDLSPGAMVNIPSQVPEAIRTALACLGCVVAPIPTEALYGPLNEREPYAGVEVQRDVKYGPDPRHMLDIFAPENSAVSRPVLVFVHGGAFVRGDRRIGTSPFNDNIAVWAARQGYVGVNMTYRLAPEHGRPAAQQDIRQALTWLRANAHSTGLDAGCIVLMGHSAGAAHVAQYLAFPEFHVAPGGGVAGVVLLSGLFDPSTAEVNPPLQAYFGADPSSYSEWSAIPGLVASAVPMLIALAELDPEDFHRQSRQLTERLTDAGKSAPTYQLMGHSHMSEIYAVNSGDTALTTLLRGFLDQATLPPALGQ